VFFVPAGTDLGVKLLKAQQGMAREGELFVSLEPTVEESRRNGGRYQYQQVVVNSLIQEFGTEVRVICQTPPHARFQIIASSRK
jgi:hypothetical protein